MADERLITATIEGRLGTYVADLYRTEASADHGEGLPGAPSLPVELEVAAFTPPKGGGMKPGQFGGGLLGSFAEVTVADPAGYIQARFRQAPFVETGYDPR